MRPVAVVTVAETDVAVWLVKVMPVALVAVLVPDVAETDVAVSEVAV